MKILKRIVQRPSVRLETLNIRLNLEEEIFSVLVGPIAMPVFAVLSILLMTEDALHFGVDDTTLVLSSLS